MSRVLGEKNKLFFFKKTLDKLVEGWYNGISGRCN
jgi:hypothetical protein